MISAASTATFRKLPGVLSFQRSYNVTDGEMLNRMPDGSLTPVEVIRHGIRGTQNVTPGAGKTAQTGERKVGNIQMTETAKLHPQAQALVVRFGFRPFDVARALAACASEQKTLMQGVRASIEDFIGRAKSGGAVDEIARRYARNMANGRWLWRNRVAAASVRITVLQAGEQLAQFDAFAVPLHRFNDASPEESKVAAALAAGFRGEPDAGVEVVAEVEFGARGATEVFPSQNYVENKPAGFARPLYKLGGSVRRPTDREAGFDKTGDAALRDQKISNALRTFDTWYDDFAELQRPIPIEPGGASLDLMDFKRTGARTAFSLLTRLNQLDPASDEGLFALACMIRGGVFSDSDKAKPGSAAEPAAEAAEAGE